MCLICIDFQKETLTPAEAWKNLQEMKDVISDEHHDEVVGMIVEKLLESEAGTENEESLAELEPTQLSFDWGELDYEEDELYWGGAWPDYDEE